MLCREPEHQVRCILKHNLLLFLSFNFRVECLFEYNFTSYALMWKKENHV